MILVNDDGATVVQCNKMYFMFLHIGINVALKGN